MSSLLWADPPVEKPEYVKDLVNPWQLTDNSASNNPETAAETERMVAWCTANPTTWALVGAAGFGRTRTPSKGGLKGRQRIDPDTGELYFFIAARSAPPLSRAAMAAMFNPADPPSPEFDPTDGGFKWTDEELETAITEARNLRATQAATAGLIV